ncbi:hypothetical protein HUF15_31070 [Streptomyces samsunensis]|uniref:Uncharacterized protein n=5 Tax=Streptomyces TaxID=1883 RepID=A0ABX6WBK8_STRMQ|nr:MULTISPECIES: hypothetical protein [Streptomyces]MYU16971.1 hypothetical protein [Streptomyces sp. SID8361]AQA13937.1 hypothetical protein BV401_29535 [Streptomyces autolyticus]MCC4319251.1 hypothetical protein [Streptomyces malaysiensis]MCD9594900.1 hypothetical protein [Streptomyces sp. 8ZJF_21]MCM3811307.1 hypothetical protein [Streptomyces sp. DR7-3]
MSTHGTIDRPATHDPMKQVPTMTPPVSDTPAPDTSGAPESRQNRNREMQLIQEALARAHMHDRIQEAESERQAVRLAAARRMQRRAERASLRARRALAMAVMQ